MRNRLISSKNGTPVIMKQQRKASVATFSCCKLKNTRRVDKMISPEDREWIKKTRTENIAFNSPLVAIFLQKINPLKLNLKREVYFYISGNNYFLDFLDEANNIAIEIDGNQHNTDDASKYDRKRDKAFRFIGIETIRFGYKELISEDFIKKVFLPKYRLAKKSLQKGI